jgi:hypothetical protein
MPRTSYTLAGLNRLLPAELSAEMNMRNQVQSKTLNYLGCCLLVCSRGDVDLYDWVELMAAIYGNPHYWAIDELVWVERPPCYCYTLGRSGYSARLVH